MSEFMKDSGHNWMRTCDGCGGAFYCAEPHSLGADLEDDDEDTDGDVADWTCDSCVAKEALADALGEISTACETKELRFYDPGDANGFSKQRRVIETVWEIARNARRAAGYQP